MAKYDIFISYARRDKDIVHKISQELSNHGITYWIDLEGILSGDEFVQRIMTAIDECRIFLILLSPNTSEWNSREFLYARNQGKHVIPLALNGYKLNNEWAFHLGATNILPLDSQSIDKCIFPIAKYLESTVAKPSIFRGNQSNSSIATNSLSNTDIFDETIHDNIEDRTPKDRDYKSMLTSFAEGKEITGETIDLFLKTIDRSVKVFIAGSKSLVKERNAIRARLMRIMNRSTMGFVIRVYTYEDFARHFVKGGQQSEYQRFIENEADFIIVIIDNKVGNITLKEFNDAYNAYCKSESHPKILVYKRERNLLYSFLFSGKKGIKEIEKKLNEINLYYIPYKDEDDLSNQILEDFSMFSR